MDRKYKSSLTADYSQIQAATKLLKDLKTPSRKFKTASRLPRNYFKSTSRSLLKTTSRINSRHLNSTQLGTTRLKACIQFFSFGVRVLLI